MTVRGMYDGRDDKGIGLTCMTVYTPLEHGDVFWHKLLWLVWHGSMIIMILKTMALFFLLTIFGSELMRS